MPNDQRGVNGAPGYAPSMKIQKAVMCLLPHLPRRALSACAEQRCEFGWPPPCISVAPTIVNMWVKAVP
jgi:hypothetical protein